MTEALTEEERADIQSVGQSDPDFAHLLKAIRLLDAHAEDRAALAVRLEAVEREMHSSHRVSENLLRARDALVAQVAELTRERDEAADARDMARQGWSEANAEVTRTIEALAAENRNCASESRSRMAAEARVRELDGCLRLAVNQRDIAETRGQELETQLAKAKRRQFNEQKWAEKCAEVNQLTETNMALEAQFQREAEIAQEWRDTAERYRLDLQVALDKIQALEAITPPTK